jgi:phospho-N-acetylmuramoyl-pentapeptide-transferase
MLYEILNPLASDVGVLRLFGFLTFRTGGAVVTALFISFILGGPLINWLRSQQGEGQPIRDDGPESHIIQKAGTPTMGGALILLALVFSTILWVRLDNKLVWSVLIVTVGFGLIGAIDDYLKLARRSTGGLSGKLKLVGQLVISILVVLWVAMPDANDKAATSLAIPFVNLLVNLGWFFIPFAVVVIIGASNAVNLTDGLDGLAIVPVMIAAGVFGLITYLVGNAKFADYLQLHHVAGSGELAVFCGALVGASLGFLWFNAPPAMVFMGDTGSLSVGGALGAIAVVTKHELVLAIVGGLFVLEAVSVIAQVISFKLTGKRVFRMAPLHHHYEQKGWKEPTIVIRFWIIASILALVGLSTLKLR